MRFMNAIAIALLLAAPNTMAGERYSREECAEVRQKIRKIQSKMRQGYTAKQGVKMEADLRKYREIRAKHCR